MRIMVLLLTIIFNISACTPQEEEGQPTLPSLETPGIPDEFDMQQSNKILLTINGSSFYATLTDNTTTKAFKLSMPMTMDMGDMNDNEKYYYLPNSLPTAATNHNKIQNGDIMLFGSSCLVIFYKSFSPSYGYTKIGKIDDVSRLQQALGSGDVSVRIELIKNE